MVTTTRFASLNRPGTFLSETTAGYRTPEIESHNTVYMVGSSESGAYNTPTLVTNITDFTNQFGASPSENSVRLYFENDSAGKLFFIRTQIATVFTVTIDTINAGSDTVTINGTAVDVTLVGDETNAEAQSAYIQAINASTEADVVTAVAGDSDNVVEIRSDSPGATLTVVGSADMTVVDVTPASLPNAFDYVYAIQNTFDTLGLINFEQGFLIAPQAFQNLASASDRLSVGVAMENLCANKDADWVALVDVGPNLTTVAEVQAEGLQYTTAQGHLAFYAPYVKDVNENIVPASAAVAGVATRRYREQGFQEAPAGTRYRLRGVTDVVTRFSNTQQDVLNPLGINLVRYLFNIGVTIWGARTRSNDSFYTFVHVRVIMNVLNGTLRGAFDNEIFTTIDGQGVLFARIRETARSVCRRFWLGRALYGATEQDAFEVVCGPENNIPDDLDNGNVALDVYVAPSPTLEKLAITTIRVGIGQVQASAAASQGLA